MRLYFLKGRYSRWKIKFVRTRYSWHFVSSFSISLPHKESAPVKHFRASFAFSEGFENQSKNSITPNSAIISFITQSAIFNELLTRKKEPDVQKSANWWVKQSISLHPLKNIIKLKFSKIKFDFESIRTYFSGTKLRIACMTSATSRHPAFNRFSVLLCLAMESMTVFCSVLHRP